MLDQGTILGLAIAAAGVISTWSVLGYRIREMEKRGPAFEALKEKVQSIDTRTRESARSQGARLEKATMALAVLRGRFIGFAEGDGRRARTAAFGHRIPEPEEDPEDPDAEEPRP